MEAHRGGIVGMKVSGLLDYEVMLSPPYGEIAVSVPPIGSVIRYPYRYHGYIPILLY